MQRLGSPTFQALRGRDAELDSTLEDLGEATSLMERADIALYRAKSRGGNDTVVAGGV